MIDLSFGMEPERHQEQKVSPRLIQANEILELTSEELQQLVAREVEENPALELAETPTCQVCGSEMLGSICPQCLSRQKGDAASEEPWPETLRGVRDLSVGEDEERDPVGRVAAEATLEERLLLQLYSLIPERDYPIADYLVGSLDENGYLQASTAEVAATLGLSEERVEAVLKQLQSLDPVGIGARNLAECLRIQMDYLEREEGIRHPVARTLVESGLLEDLAAHRYRRLAATLGCKTADVADAARFIGEKLNPHPAQSAWASEPGDQSARTARVLPDVVIMREPDGEFRVEVVESDRYMLRVSPIYRDLARLMERQPSAYGLSDQQHVRECVNRARAFVENIHQRRETIRKIAECVVREQRAFLEHGPMALKPLTRARVAQIVGFHESTISRATSGKYAMLPDRRVIPMSDFFTPSLAPKEAMRLILRAEPALTDVEIAQRLRRFGVCIARRTVAKYRAQLGILPSTRRAG